MLRARRKASILIEHVAGGGAAATGLPRRLSLWARLGVLGLFPLRTPGPTRLLV